MITRDHTEIVIFETRDDAVAALDALCAQAKSYLPDPSRLMLKP